MSDITSAEDRHNEASPNDKLDGIIEQMRADIEQGNVTDIADALRQRLDDTGVTVDARAFAALVAQLS